MTQTLGEELRLQREAKGLALAEIAEATRISTRFLKAIEADKYDILPGGIFTRSFVRAYAKYVGVDEAAAMHKFEMQTGSESVAPDPVLPDVDDGFVYREPASGLLVSATAALIAAVLVGSAGWAAWHYLSDGRSSQTAVLQPAVADDTSSEPAPAASPTAVEPGSPAERLRVTLSASDRCWVRYTVDDGQPTQTLLNVGDQRDINANEVIDLSVGNTQAVSMRINDRAARFPTEGTHGVVLKKLTITPESAATLVD